MQMLGVFYIYYLVVTWCDVVYSCDSHHRWFQVQIPAQARMVVFELYIFILIL